MGWMLLLCLRFRTRWRMSSSLFSPCGGVAGVGCAPFGVWGLLFFGV